jgi:aminopeptidase N
MEGADLWWPCKDHPSDKPESMDLSFTVPEGLVVATNGRRIGSSTLDGKTTSQWRVSTPIANYTVAFNAAPYVELVGSLESVAGDTFPVIFWVLPENKEKGEAFMAEILEHLRFFERFCGPYPFRGDKYGVVETPHLGMEHQSIIAYGNKYRGDPNFDYDWLHHHELAHEWWANLVTARDWADFWIHEGIGTYMQPLYLEERFGREAYQKKMKIDLLRVMNNAPVAPAPPRTSDSIYFSKTGTDAPGGDIYFKGSWICHSLRWLLGDETFFKVLRRWAYPDPALEKTTDGSAVRFSDTDELLAIAEEVSGRKLGWFFEVYLRRGPLPVLAVERDGGTLSLRWEAPDELPFPMPVEVMVGGEARRVPMEGGEATLEVGEAEVEVDPELRVLRDLRR